MKMTNKLLRVSLLLVVAGILFFLHLKQVPLFDPDEGRYSEMSLHMVESGDWLVPHMNGIVHLHKPPLVNWLIAASFKLVGPSEFSARLPGVLLSLLLLLLMVRLGTFLFDFQTGYYASWILLTSALYIAVSRLVTTDITLTFFTFLAMFCVAHLFYGTKNKLFYFYGFMISLGLGMLTKGPVAWMITLVPTVFFAIWKKKRFGIPAFHWVLGIFVGLGIAFSWYVLVISKMPGLLDYFLHYQLAGRIVKGSAGRAQPFFYYLIVIPLGFFPWSLFLPAATSWIRSQAPSSEFREKLLFVLTWLVAPLILFSLFRTKLATYIIPLFPPLALLSACFWKAFSKVPGQEASRSIRISSWILTASYTLALIGGIVFIYLRPQFIEGIHRRDLIILGACLLGASIFLSVLVRQRKFHLLFKTQAALLLLLTFISLDALPSIRFKNSRIFVEQIQKFRKPGDLVIMWSTYTASLPFYLRERIISVGVETEVNFETPANLENYIYSNERLDYFLGLPQRVFILTSVRNSESLRDFTTRPIYPILKQSKLLLFTNHPLKD